MCLSTLKTQTLFSQRRSVYYVPYIVCMYACRDVCMYACMHVEMYACRDVCMYACMHVEM